MENLRHIFNAYRQACHRGYPVRINIALNLSGIEPGRNAIEEATKEELIRHKSIDSNEM